MEIAFLVHKNLTSTLSHSEKSELERWLSESEENQFLFQSIENFHNNGGDISALTELNAEDAWKKVMLRYTSNKKVNKHGMLQGTYKYAAILIIALAAGYFYWSVNFKSGKVVEEMVQSQQGIVLVLDNGEKIEFSSSDQQELVDKQGNKLGQRSGRQLNYTHNETMDELVYNTLTIPNGQRFDIILSDNSHVYLNAGSSLRYPVTFLPGKKRQVYLQGEAFFEVSKDKDHPFVVTSDNMDVEVLGTKFNVSAYPEEEDISTVLVEGSVKVNANQSIDLDQDHSLLLIPGHMAQWDKKSKSAQMEKVDTDQYTSWMQGKLVLRGMKFREIIKKLERHYGVIIDNKNESLNNRTFTATFDVESMEEVLNTFVSETKFEYRIEGKQITILNNQNQESPMK
ncbi:FecR family protein [Flagellimonas sediminis]|uniref:DUF4974 domain-containing protein n=1 Tax=Flagellimonas sediminis TaxID=2696468 RepID=A0A6I5KY44_9FLAO|nr:FecR domain-containing protein [Allomuricauda sediminis]NDV44719.1 DUF4974 domain-containing protein [Allomuricauda sediminis]